MQTGTVSGNGVKWLEKEADRVRYFPDIGTKLRKCSHFFHQKSMKKVRKERQKVLCATRTVNQ